MRGIIVLGLFSALAGGSCATHPGAVARTLSPCVVTDDSATAFGPSMSPSDSARVYSHVLSPDGGELYFFKRVGTAPEDYRIFRSLRARSGWSAPEQVDLGDNYSDLYPTISPDGRRLVFASYRPVSGDTATRRNAHIWMARRHAGGWSAPEFVPASKLGYYHSGLRHDATGNLQLMVTTPDWRTTQAMYLRWNSNSFDATMASGSDTPAAEHWRTQLGDSLHIWGAIPGPDRLHLLAISRIMPGGRRAPNTFFATYLLPTGWAPLRPVGGGLSTGSPNFAWFSADGCYIHYTRNYWQFMRVPIAVALRSH